MSGNTPQQSTVESLRRAQSHWRRRPGSQPDLPTSHTPARFTIAISRQRGARGSNVAHEVGALLNWHVYDRDLVEQIVEDSGVLTQLVESVDECPTSWLRECLEAFTQAPTISSTKYMHCLAQVLTALAEHGESVIVGRGAGFLLPSRSTLRIGLVAPFKQRVARVREDHGLTEREATRHVKQVDSQRNAFVKEHFHKDPNDTELYDMVLNTGRLSPRCCAELIVETLARVTCKPQPVNSN